jgi:peptidoglycan/LPS O-acetylase OafA/YrhL
MLLVFLVREAVKFGAVEWLGVSASTPTFTDNSARAFGSNLLLIHALGLHDHLTFNGPSWSISTEFYAYIFFGLIVLALGNRSRATQLASFPTISVSSLVFLSRLFHDESAGEIVATSQSVGTLLLVLYIGLVLLVSHMTFRYVEEPFRRKTKAWVLATPLRHPRQSLLLPARG